MLLMSVFVVAQDSHQDGVIRGTVLSITGTPVATARVQASPMGPIAGVVPSAISDSSGRFVIQHLPLGGYHVTAAEDQDGYPDQSFAFYTGPNWHPVVVELDSNHPDEDVTIHVGRKAGVIFGNVVDAETHEPVEPCAELRWKEQPSISLSGTGLIKSRFHLFVPADTPITVALWQRGYEPWFYRDQRGNDSLRVGEGQEVNLEIQMRPEGDREGPPSYEELRAMVEFAARSGCSTPPPAR